MAILKCKMCGGDLTPVEDASTLTCEYCGTTQTIPKVDDEKKMMQFGRADRLRRQCEFDKAAGVYESIVADFPEEAEAYWGLVLCKYGIEYVDDPATGKKTPTCHRSSFDSIMEDEDFEQALENADSVARKVYREEAKTIEEIRKGIVAVSANEQPYDIFICYKETAEDGDRTLDSVLAQDIYDALTDKGYRVFFSRITLEDKLGLEYEPYIFAALNSAKVMLAVGTDYEYYNAVWVKNEWSRYLKLMAQDKEKHLIPCYKNIDAYDMPREFAKLQAQDLGKVGALQDLLRGIEKLLPKQGETIKETVVVQQSTSAATPLLERGYLFLEDKDWNSANEYFEKVLDLEPKNAAAYLGKLLAELHLIDKVQLGEYAYAFGERNSYQKAVRFADDRLRLELENYLVSSKEYEQKRLEKEAEEERIAREKREEEERKAREIVAGNVRKLRGKILSLRNLLVAGAEHCVGLKSDGTVLATGDNFYYQCNVEHWRDVVSVGAGDRFTVGLKSNGKVLYTGSGGRLYDWVPTLENVIAISAGRKHVAALCTNGMVLAAGDNTFGQCNTQGWRGIVAIQSGEDYTLGVTDSGDVMVAGRDNICKEIRDSVLNQESVSVEAIKQRVVILKSDGTVDEHSCITKKNTLPESKNWHNIIATSSSEFHTIALTDDGNVVAEGDNLHFQCDVRSWTDMVAICTAETYSLGLKRDGSVLATGNGIGWSWDVKSWKLFTDFENLEQERKVAKEKRVKMDQLQSAGVCQHCGGAFKGLFSKTCTVCGKPKDY